MVGVEIFTGYLVASILHTDTHRPGGGGDEYAGEFVLPCPVVAVKLIAFQLLFLLKTAKIEFLGALAILEGDVGDAAVVNVVREFGTILPGIHGDGLVERGPAGGHDVISTHLATEHVAVVIVSIGHATGGGDGMHTGIVGAFHVS